MLRPYRLSSFAWLLLSFASLVACDPHSLQGPIDGAPVPSAVATTESIATAPLPTDAQLPDAGRPRLGHLDRSLIPRHAFQAPDHVHVRISPDGRELAWIAPAAHGVRNVWVAPASELGSARVVTRETLRHVRTFEWGPTSAQIFYPHDANGDENSHVYVVDVARAETRDLTPGSGFRAVLETTSAKDPRHVVVAANDRDPRMMDLYRVDLVTGERSLLAVNEGDYASWSVDNRLRVTGAHRANADGSIDLLVFDKREGDRQVRVGMHIPFEDVGTVEFIGRDANAHVDYVRDARSGSHAGLTAVDTKTGTVQVLADDPHADLGYVLDHSQPKAVSFSYDRTRWQVLDPALQPDFDYLATVAPGDLAIENRSNEDRRWVVSYRASNLPPVYILYDRSGAPGVAGTAVRLFSQSAALDGYRWPKANSVVVRARDGLELLGYLTLPLASDETFSGRPDHALPMVLWVHGGPQERAGGGFDDNAQWLANRGYAVLTVNFRGSTGLGKALLDAGNGEYGRKMQDDLEDAAAWAVAQGVADPTKIAIAGATYGGYAALLGLASRDATFACAVDIAGMTDVEARLQNFPYDQPRGAWETKRVGDPTTTSGRALLADISPVTHVKTMQQRPLLVVQGSNDVRVRPDTTDRFVAAASTAGIPLTYVVYPDEGHSLERPENLATLGGVTELFLARCLGGAFEPIADDDAGSSWTSPQGFDRLDEE